MSDQDAQSMDFGLGDNSSPEADFSNVVIGGGQFVRPSGAVQSQSSIDGARAVDLAFENASISQVVEAVIGGVLNANFVIDPNVSGFITLKTARSADRDDLLGLLTQALRLNDVELIETSPANYSIIPRSSQARYPRAPRLASTGQNDGIVIMPLDFVSAQEMLRILQPLSPQGVQLQADEAREVLFLRGEPAQIDMLIETIDMFDVDWLSEMSFGIYDVSFTSPEVLAAELETVFGGEDGPIGSQVEFIPLPRLGSIMVVAKRPERLTQAQNWIRRLDINAEGDGRRFHFVSVENADAQSVADTLSDVFTDQNPSSSDGSSGSNRSQDRSIDNPRIRAEAASNALIVYATDDELRQIRSLLTNIDVLPDQVLIEVVIAEVALNDDLRYGVQWFFDSRTGGDFTFSDASSGAVSVRFPGFAYRFTDNYVQAALSALSAVTNIEVVSSPQIVTQDNQTATLQVGDQVPVVTQSAVSVDNPNAPIVNSIQYRDTGILLTVTPRINDGNNVVLEISQEVSDAVPTLTSGIDAPTIQQRQFDSVVSIADGETLALGGLIRASKSTGRSGIPILKDVPLIGNAFSSRSDNRSRSELIIFLTPRIIRSPDDARRVSDHLRSKLQYLQTSGFSDAPSEP